MLLAPSQFKIDWQLKRRLGCKSTATVNIAELPFPVRGDHLDHHDLYHLEVARLPRILMGKHWVSGIHGVNFHLFHDSPIVEEYDGIFDEARVAVHEWLTRPACYNTVKIIVWSGWFLLQGINPIAVIWRHHRSLQISRHTSFLGNRNGNI